MFFLSAEVAKGVLILSPKGDGKVHLQPSPTRKEEVADLLMRWVRFLYPEIISYMLEIDKINIFLCKELCHA